MTPFDNEKYKNLQIAELKERINKFGRVYMEVGGKLFDDHHAERVLPGFNPNVKMQIFSEMAEELEVIFCINARDIITGKTRADNSLTYAEELLRLVDVMKTQNISVCAVFISFYEDHPLVNAFEDKCKAQSLQVCHSYYIEGYPNDLNKILSADGFGKNDYAKVTKDLVLVSAPGANSGKLQTCLSQIYNDKVRGNNSFYAKYETFPVWNLPLNHLVNIAYEMSTVDLGDVNMIDPFYKNAYGKDAVNYNRDIAAFPILNEILTQIAGRTIYNSPTDMGINNAGNAIVDDLGVQKASYEEIVRRHEKHILANKQNKLSSLALERSKHLLEKATKIYNSLTK